MAMKLFVELIQIALNNRAELSQTPTENQWQALFALAKKQALLGVTYAAIERLSAEQRPTRRLLLQWGVITERIKERNEELNTKIPAISQRFHSDGEGFGCLLCFLNRGGILHLCLLAQVLGQVHAGKVEEVAQGRY